MESFLLAHKRHSRIAVHLLDIVLKAKGFINIQHKIPWLPYDCTRESVEGVIQTSLLNNQIKIVVSGLAAPPMAKESPDRFIDTGRSSKRREASDPRAHI